MHAVEPRLAAGRQPAGRGERAARKSGAVLRQMRELHALTGTSEHQSVLAHDVAATQHAEADRTRGSRSGVALPRVDRRIGRAGVPRATATASPSVIAVPLGASTLSR